MSDDSQVWLFQGNPKVYDIDAYLSRHPYIYWHTNRHRSAIKEGERCILWKAGKDAGMIAVGTVVEEPQPISDIPHPDFLGSDLWGGDSEEDPTSFKTGISIEEFRLDADDGMVGRQAFVDDPVLSESQIIRIPTGTVFRLTEDEGRAAFSLWESGDKPTSHRCLLETVPSRGTENRVLRLHYRRERNRRLIEDKRDDFAASHDGNLFCEVCGFDFSKNYPAGLGDGFIEVHHLIPLGSLESPHKTTLDDLLLVCSNCHRMIHRTADSEGNLELLRNHFAI